MESATETILVPFNGMKGEKSFGVYYATNDIVIRNGKPYLVQWEWFH